MEEEDLLELALDFFGLEKNFREEEFKTKYKELAKKYHPDSSEFTSSVLFNELQRSKEILEKFLSQKTGTEEIHKTEPKVNKKNNKDEIFELYKESKEIENKSILKYYEKTKGNPVFLKEEDNPPLRELRKDLRIPVSNYLNILQNHPESIWARDAEDSLKRLRVWIGESRQN